jgi:membrane-associated phospholipid phosphatase
MTALPASPSHPPSLSPRALAATGAVAATAASVIFLSLSWKVATYAPIVVNDVEIANWLHNHGTPELTAFMIAVSDFHGVAGSALLALAFGAVLAWLRQWYWLGTLVLAMGGGMAINSLLKEAFARVRPYFDDPWVWLTSHSFPSGHTAGAVLFYGVLAAFLVSRFYEPRRRLACLAGAVFAIALVAFSRMYLGAHYLSDVVAAACSSTVWLVFCLTAVHEVVRRRMHGR